MSGGIAGMGTQEVRRRTRVRVMRRSGCGFIGELYLLVPLSTGITILRNFWAAFTAFETILICQFVSPLSIR